MNNFISRCISCLIFLCKNIIKNHTLFSSCDKIDFDKKIKIIPGIFIHDGLKNKIKTYTIQRTEYTYFQQAAIKNIRENQKTSGHSIILGKIF